MNNSRYAAKKIATLAVFTALSLITFIIENALPPLIIPGAKMGLANIFSFAALILYSPLEGFAVVAVRSVLGAVFAGNVSSVMYSFTGGMVSMAVSSVLLYAVHPGISVTAVSVAAAVINNVTQNLVYVAVVGNAVMLSYMPYLALIGIVSGAIVGATVMLLFKKVPLSVYEKALKNPIEQTANSN